MAAGCLELLKQAGEQHTRELSQLETTLRAQHAHELEIVQQACNIAYNDKVTMLRAEHEEALGNLNASYERERSGAIDALAITMRQVQTLNAEIGSLRESMRELQNHPAHCDVRNAVQALQEAVRKQTWQNVVVEMGILCGVQGANLQRVLAGASRACAAACRSQEAAVREQVNTYALCQTPEFQLGGRGLPTDASCYIVGYCTVHDLFQIACSSSNGMAVFSSPKSWQGRVLNLNGRSASSGSFFRTSARVARLLGFLKIGQWCHLDGIILPQVKLPLQMWDKLADAAPSISMLDLRCVSRLSDEAVEVICKGFTRLERLVMPDSLKLLSTSISGICKLPLHGLWMRDCLRLYESFGLLSRMARIEELSIGLGSYHFFPNLDNDIHNVLPHLQMLKILDLTNSCIGEIGIRALAQHPRLQRLTLQGVRSHVSLTTLIQFAGSVSLRRLDLRCAGNANLTPADRRRLRESLPQVIKLQINLDSADLATRRPLPAMGVEDVHEVE